MDQQKLKEQASNPYNFSPNMERSVRQNYQAPNDLKLFERDVQSQMVFG
jgi:hypothetical protein